MVKFVDASGRAFTDYSPNCELNRDIKEAYGIDNNYNYKMFLQRNAEKLMQQDRSYSYIKNKITCNCPNCVRIAGIRN